MVDHNFLGCLSVSVVELAVGRVYLHENIILKFSFVEFYVWAVLPDLMKIGEFPDTIKDIKCCETISSRG